MDFDRLKETESLVLRAQAKDAEAFETLLNLYKPLLLKHVGVYDHVCDVNELYSAACEGLLRAVEHWTVDGGAHFSRYAETCVEHQVRAYVRKNTRPLDPLPEELSEPSFDEQALIHRDIMERVLVLVRHLASDLEYAVLSHYLRGCPPRDIAVHLGRSIKEVTNAKARLISKMRKNAAMFAEFL